MYQMTSLQMLVSGSNLTNNHKNVSYIVNI